MTIDYATGRAIEPPKQTAMDRLADAAKQAAVALAGNLRDSTPFSREGMAKGLGTMAAELRGGLIDLQKMVVQAFPDSITQEAVMGEIGIPTPGQVDREREVVQLEPANERTRGADTRNSYRRAL